MNESTRIFAAAQELSEVVDKLVGLREVESISSQLSTRRSELQHIVPTWEKLTLTIDVLPDSIRTNLPSFESSSLLAKVSDLAADFRKDPSTIVKPKAIPSKDADKLATQIEELLQEEWSYWVLDVSTPMHPDLAMQAGDFEGVQGVVSRIRELQSALRKAANTLPVSTDQVQQIVIVQTEFQNAVAELIEQGFDESKLKFLLLSRSGGSGFRLADLLENESLIEWLRESGVLEHCLVNRTAEAV